MGPYGWQKIKGSHSTEILLPQPIAGVWPLLSNLVRKKAPLPKGRAPRQNTQEPFSFSKVT